MRGRENVREQYVTNDDDVCVYAWCYSHCVVCVE